MTELISEPAVQSPVIDEETESPAPLALLTTLRFLDTLGLATFFLLLVVSFIDVLGGFAITLRSAQRDLTVEGVERVSS